MNDKIAYYDFVEHKINSLCLENKNILNHKTTIDEQSDNLIITLIYDSFTVKMKYGTAITEDYSFMESENIAKSLIPKFLFAFSVIEYSLYDIHNTVEDNIFRTYAFHCLYDKTAVGDAFDTIISFIDRNYDKISEINSSTHLQNKLNDSFESGLKITSKKITPDKIRENPDKYLHSHDTDMYFFRFQETVFVSNIINKSSRALNSFYIRQSKKRTLLPFENRYIHYLLKNDLTNTDNDTIERVKKNQNISKTINISNAITMIISLISALAFGIAIGSLIEKKLEKDYFLLREVTLDHTLALIFLTVGFSMILEKPVTLLFMRKKKGYDNASSKRDKKIDIIFSIIGVAVITLSCTFFYFDYQKNVGLGKNDVYYCQKLGKVQILPYNKIKLYLIEGCYYDDEYSDTDADKKIAVVVNNDYKNCFVSEYLTEIDMPDSYRDSLNYEKKYKSIEEFKKNYL